MNRIGIRVQDVFDEKILRQKVEVALDLKNQMLAKVYNRRAIDVDEIVDELVLHRDRLAPMAANTGLVLHEALDRGATVLLEAGQGNSARRRPRNVPVRHLILGDSRGLPAPGQGSRRPGSRG